MIAMMDLVISEHARLESISLVRSDTKRSSEGTLGRRRGHVVYQSLATYGNHYSTQLISI